MLTVACLLLLSGSVLATEAGSGADSFVPGAICDDVDPLEFLRNRNNGTGMTASRALSGKHLRFVELEWAPFATFDAATNTWSGIDIDMLTELSSRLNFTHDIIPMVHITGDTWTTTLFNHLTQGDLIGCYWMNTRERRDRSYMLNGHVDSSIMLAVPPMEVEELDLLGSG